MTTYFRCGGHETASDLTKARYEAYQRNGLLLEDIARFELSNIIGIIINATPSIFWLLYFLHADPGLLADVRAEVQKTCITAAKGDGRINVLDVTKLRGECSLLMAAYRETLRIKTNNVTSRWVRRDTNLNGEYLLKKDSIVQIPGASIHADATLWGPDTAKFKAARFIDSKHRTGAFRAFGGGASLCPGRHFAMYEIVATAAMFILRYDLSPIDGVWKEPRTDGSDVLNSVAPPTSEMMVHVAKIRNGGDDEWEFHVPLLSGGFEV